MPAVGDEIPGCGALTPDGSFTVAPASDGDDRRNPSLATTTRETVPAFEPHTIDVSGCGVMSVPPACGSRPYAKGTMSPPHRAYSVARTLLTSVPAGTVTTDCVAGSVERTTMSVQLPQSGSVCSAMRDRVVREADLERGLGNTVGAPPLSGTTFTFVVVGSMYA